MEHKESSFEWDPYKEWLNVLKHQVDFLTAEKAFDDPLRKIFVDLGHSLGEDRYFCVGKVNDKVLTVRFVYKGSKIRIIGAGFWRKGRKRYDQKKEK